MIRITADIDNKSKLKLLFYIAKALKHIKKIKRIEINKSYSGNYHIIIWSNQKYNLKEQFKLREIIGDDKHRLKMDKLRRFGRNTLFYKKEKYYDIINVGGNKKEIKKTS